MVCLAVSHLRVCCCIVLQAGWAKVQEIRKYIAQFRQSGKFSMAYMSQAGEKEYYLASAFEEIYIPPTANIRLNGFSVAGVSACIAVGMERCCAAARHRLVAFSAYTTFTYFENSLVI